MSGGNGSNGAKRLRIGEILAGLGAAEPERIEEVAKEREKMSADQVLGELLVARGVIDPRDLKRALRLQKRLGARSSFVRALAAAELAEQSGTEVRKLSQRVLERAKSSERSRTEPGGFPAVPAGVGGEDG